LTPEEFERLLDQWEGDTLEFKREMPASADLAKLVTAFYNTRGGTIIFGVADEARQLVGVTNPQGIEGGIVNILRARCSLDVMPAIEVLSFQGKEFVVVTCPQGAHKPYLASGETRPYVRIGSSNREAQDAEVRRLYVEGHEGGFEALPCRGATIADLSQPLMAAYLRQREATSGQRLGLSWEEALRNLGGLTAQGEVWMPTHAGVMLFAEDPQRLVAQAEVACVRFKGADVISYLDRRDLRGPLYQLVDDAEQFIYRHMKIGRRIEGFVGVEYREYPHEAVREAIVNAVVHRDYGRQGQRIRVFIPSTGLRAAVRRPDRSVQPGYTAAGGFAGENAAARTAVGAAQSCHRRRAPRFGQPVHRAPGHRGAPDGGGHGDAWPAEAAI